MKQKISLAVTLLLAYAGHTASAAFVVTPDLGSIRFTVKVVEGSLGSSKPPQVGDTVTIDAANLPSRSIEFLSGSSVSSVVPLPPNFNNAMGGPRDGLLVEWGETVHGVYAVRLQITKGKGSDAPHYTGYLFYYDGQYLCTGLVIMKGEPAK
jgi:hypothetical protein